MSRKSPFGSLWLAGAVLMVLLSPANAAAQAGSPATLPRVQAAHISYSGAFRMPNTGAEARLGYGGNALGYNPVNRSLFVGGHDWYQRLCEVSIPAPSKASSYNDLPLAAILQSCTDVTEGTLASVKADAKLGGSLVYNGRLITSAWSYYDADCSQRRTHGASSTLNLSAAGDFSGFVQMQAAAEPRALAGYMTLIPEVWRSLFGGPALTGLGGVSIISCASSGLAATVFNPDDVGVRNPIPGTTLLNYPDPGSGIARELFHWLKGTATRGIAFPESSRSVLFVGVQGDTECYGAGTGNPALDRQPVPGWDDLIYCYDPCSSSKGTHSYPYHIKVWAYDANEMLTVKSGQANPWDIRPYGIWTLAEMENNGCASIRGAAFDPADGRLFIAPGYGEQPIIHVYNIARQDIVPPAAPQRLRIR